MAEVIFEDYSVSVKGAIRDKAISFLEEIGGELRSMIQTNSRRDTSQTAGSYQYKVVDSDLVVHVGSDNMNAIWEEFGTGIHAQHGGRKTAWKYKDRHGKWHTTKGKTAHMPMQKSYASSKGRIQRRAEQIFKELNS